MKTLSRLIQQRNTHPRTSYQVYEAYSSRTVPHTCPWNALVPPCRLATPPEYQATLIPKENLVYSSIIYGALDIRRGVPLLSQAFYAGEHGTGGCGSGPRGAGTLGRLSNQPQITLEVLPLHTRPNAYHKMNTKGAIFVAFFQSYRRHFTPRNMVLAGAGVDHEELVRLGEKYFGGLEAAEGEGAWASANAAKVAESQYHGGESRIVIPAEKARYRL